MRWFNRLLPVLFVLALCAVVWAQSIGPPSAGVAPSPTSNTLGSDVNLNVVGNFFPGPSITGLGPGTWWASSTVTIQTGTANDQIFCKLWDGSTVIDSTTMTLSVINSGYTISLSGFLANPSGGNILISCRDPNSTTGLIRTTSSGAGQDSKVSVYRIQ